MMNAKELMAGGLAFVCAMCERMERGIGQGETVCEAALLERPCGGPVVGMGFPQYDGMLTKAQLGGLCFRCGNTAVGGFETPQGLVGVCAEHHADIQNRKLVPVQAGGVD